jgi:hypothetical protein
MDDISWLGGEDIPHAHVISYIPDSLSKPAKQDRAGLFHYSPCTNG